MRHCVRLTGGMDLMGEIRALARRHAMAAAVPIACVGSLSRWRVRGADGKTIHERTEPVEIVSLTGTVSMDGCHLHIALAREDLSVLGGHLQEGCIVHTTAEIVLETLDGYAFTREMDEGTGYRELKISEK